jgi:hypothetical protein
MYVATSPVNDPSNPDAVPAFDGWGFGDYWDAADWITWHQALVRKYGLRQANATFVAYWKEQTFGAAPLNAKSFDESFRAYARANGFLDQLYSGLDVITEPLGMGTDILSGATDLAGGIPSALDAAGNAVKSISFVWPLVLVGLALIYAREAQGSAKKLFRS